MIRDRLAQLLPFKITRTRIRIFFTVIIFISTFQLGYSYIAEGSSSTSRLQEQAAQPYDQRSQIIPASNNMTVVTGWNGPLVVFDSKGRVYYYDASHRSYWDVDPIPNESHTLIYAANDHLNSSKCPAKVRCTVNYIERVNISTGEKEVLYTEYAPGYGPKQWHDVDRINDTHVVVADIVEDEVFIVDTTSGIKTWVWEAQNDFNISSGGSEAFGTSWPDDWTHVNDVEVLSDGRIMVSLRNQDQVVFINRQNGLMTNWTLGADNNYSIMAEQHNPDYIPEANGGPAVLIADSHNDRIIEYQREDGEWEQSWVYTNPEMNWPRDADRLPNGNTLITISNSQKLIEINQRGNIVWSAEFNYNIYESERLETGDESTNGPSAEKADLTSRGEANGKFSGEFVRGSDERFVDLLKNILPKRVVSGLLFILPPWIDSGDIFWILGISSTIFIWILSELKWSPYTQYPVTLSTPR